MTEPMKFNTTLSVEHRRQISRFCGIPFDDEEDQCLRAYTAFRIWHHAAQLAAKPLAQQPREPRRAAAMGGWHLGKLEPPGSGLCGSPLLHHRGDRRPVFRICVDPTDDLSLKLHQPERLTDAGDRQEPYSGAQST